MARIHGLQHIESFLPAYFSHDDSVRTHPQTVDNQLSCLNSALSFRIGRTAFQSHNVSLLQLQFCRILDRDNALLRGDITGEHIQQRGLARARPARDYDVETCRYSRLQESKHPRSQGLIGEQVFFSHGHPSKTPDGKMRAVDGKRWKNHVDSRSVGESSVDHRGGFVYRRPTAEMILLMVHIKCASSLN